MCDFPLNPSYFLKVDFLFCLFVREGGGGEVVCNDNELVARIEVSAH